MIWWSFLVSFDHCFLLAFRHFFYGSFIFILGRFGHWLALLWRVLSSWLSSAIIVVSCFRILVILICACIAFLVLLQITSIRIAILVFEWTMSISIFLLLAQPKITCAIWRFIVPSIVLHIAHLSRLIIAIACILFWFVPRSIVWRLKLTGRLWFFHHL